ncbi:MAG: CAP domain-containing protein, partial [Myxococcales bacterium]|nr:CAP domain-containing protein [Myxococcales bacterium]
MRRPTLALLLPLAFGLGAEAPALAQQDADAEAVLFTRINALRAEAGVAPLERHSGLDAAAAEHCVDMAEHGELQHVSERTGDPSARVERAGVAAARIAENIARHATVMGAHEAVLGSA